MRTNEQIEVTESRIDLDPATQEWIDGFEGPSLPLLAAGVERPAYATAPPEPLDARTADWRGAQQFPVVPLLQGAVRSARTPTSIGVRRPEQKSFGACATNGFGFASNLVVGSMFGSGGDYAVVR